MSEQTGLPLEEIERWYQKFSEAPTLWTGRVYIILEDPGDPGVYLVTIVEGTYVPTFFQEVAEGGMQATFVRPETGIATDFNVIAAVPDVGLRYGPGRGRGSRRNPPW